MPTRGSDRRHWFHRERPATLVEPGQQYRHPGVNGFGRPFPVWEVIDIRRGVDNQLAAELRLLRDASERKLVSIEALRDGRLYEQCSQQLR